MISPTKALILEKQSLARRVKNKFSELDGLRAEGVEAKQPAFAGRGPALTEGGRLAD
jgi:hypothetical protein